ncbi:LacI family DNA-binding transcriptional regulator [Paenibacillus sp. MWE-103]|uniref:LacI family DNA-binding transcriptional regulator n=1 Tax=Paenibacillus artemisiicola TaxID=1172618 RepID=A0ABS3WJ76_9BACL|nr:LacI family DNA-binding transcriptional regulator [Paenibacillus artemisiicola]MBO7748383.1 LacI family DNA-binding transcriptional regulator [Paenibacillus artemisiicola]
MKPTIYDVAREAGVSIATVSKVINRTGKISEQTRARVTDIMEAMGYAPNLVATALSSKKTYMLGLLLPDISNPYFAELARNIEDRAHELGYNIVICNTDNRVEKERDYLTFLQQKGVDGVLLATGLAHPESLDLLTDRKLPVTVIAREVPRSPVNTVLVDDYMGGLLATSHLLRLGHRDIAIIVESMDLESSRQRLKGYRAALAAHDVAFEGRRVAVSDFSVASGMDVAGAILDAADRPTAVFACNDLLAIGTIQAARARGIPVPGELSVVGFDNTFLCGIIDPALTTVGQPIRELGRQAVDLLHKQMGGEEPARQRVVLLPELVVRASTQAPGGAAEA